MRSGFSFLRSAVAILLFCFISAELPAEDASPKKFRNGVFVNRINDFDVKKGTAEVDFWYWLISDDSGATLQNLELSNGKMEPVGEIITQKRNGLYYLSRRYIAQVQCKLDLEKFPFDEQRIVLSFEDSDLTCDQMVFVPDTANSGIDPSFSMNEWDILKIEYEIGKHHYTSSFGYLDIPSGQGSDYSQFNAIITLSRRGSVMQKLFKYFWAVVVSVIVGLFSLLIRVCDLDGRFGMAVGALFANVGCSFLLSDKLPESPTVSTAEWVSYISLGFIMLFLVESIISLAIYNRDYTKFSKWLDWGTFIVSIAGYGLMWVFI
ncbi:MAG: hypothetical protein J5806_01760 [Lentisphaeria bacterium]|nr:hypothetical protein [Lentisphaeria bacterium]